MGSFKLVVRKRGDGVSELHVAVDRHWEFDGNYEGMDYKPIVLTHGIISERELGFIDELVDELIQLKRAANARLA